MPAATASSTIYWRTGLSTMGSISLGTDLEAGSIRVPSPAAGMTALRTFIEDILLTFIQTVAPVFGVFYMVFRCFTG